MEIYNTLIFFYKIIEFGLQIKVWFTIKSGWQTKPELKKEEEVKPEKILNLISKLQAASSA